MPASVHAANSRLYRCSRPNRVPSCGRTAEPSRSSLPRERSFWVLMASTAHGARLRPSITGAIPQPWHTAPSRVMRPS